MVTPWWVALCGRCSATGGWSREAGVVISESFSNLSGIMAAMEQWGTLQYLQAGAYIAIMLAVLGVPQMLSSYFDLRARRHTEERQREERREERRQDEERHREERRERRQEAEAAERRHHEMMTLMAAVLINGRNQGNGQSELIRDLQQTIEDLRAENDRLRAQNGNGDSSQSP